MGKYDTHYKLTLRNLKSDKCHFTPRTKFIGDFCTKCTPNPNAILSRERDREINEVLFDERTCEYVVVVDVALDPNGQAVQYYGFEDFADKGYTEVEGLAQYIRPAVRQIL